MQSAGAALLEDWSTAGVGILHLPEERSRAIQVVYMKGRTYEEAAVATGAPLESRKRYLRLGWGLLGEQLAGILKSGRSNIAGSVVLLDKSEGEEGTPVECEQIKGL